jgi:hypothetical protein
VRRAWLRARGLPPGLPAGNLSRLGGCDAWVWFDHTTSVIALPTHMREGLEETYPFGL